MTVSPTIDARTVARYGKIAPFYDRLHARWLRHAGGEAQSAFEGSVAALLRPSMDVLDAGCGTGMLARRVRRITGGDISLTLLDACPQMLDRTHDIDAARFLGRLENLPFEARKFDLVTCAWALETSLRTQKAIWELMRVTRIGGHVCVVFCADAGAPGAIGRAMRQAVEFRRTGRFLKPDQVAEAFLDGHAASVRRIRCRGPAAAMVVRI